VRHSEVFLTTRHDSFGTFCSLYHGDQINTLSLKLAEVHDCFFVRNTWIYLYLCYKLPTHRFRMCLAVWSDVWIRTASWFMHVKRILSTPIFLLTIVKPQFRLTDNQLRLIYVAQSAAFEYVAYVWVQQITTKETEKFKKRWLRKELIWKKLKSLITHVHS